MKWSAGWLSWFNERMRPGAEPLLRQEAWRNERTINAFRAVTWIVVCTSVLLVGQLRGDPFLPQVALGAVYGVICAVAGVLWLRHQYHEAVPYVVSALDLVILATIADRTHVLVLAVAPELASVQLHDALPAFMLLLGVNALRFSWRVTAWTTLVAIAAFVTVLLRHERPALAHVLLNVTELIVLGVIVGTAAHRLRQVIHRVKERDAFARFLPEPIVEQLSRDPTALDLGGSQQEATVLFADIRNFTSLSEKMDPHEVVSLLNEYFTEMVEEVFDNNGVLDKFLGDGICAVFGDLLGQHDHARRAVRCARGMLTRLDRINLTRVARGEPALRMGVGLHSGSLVAGNIGSPRRLEYTHIGDTVNTASRVEALTKTLGCELLLTAATRDRLEEGDAALKSMGTREIRGRQPLALYSLR